MEKNVYMHICVTESLCCTAEINITCKSIHFKKILKKVQGVWLFLLVNKICCLKGSEFQLANAVPFVEANVCSIRYAELPNMSFQFCCSCCFKQPLNLRTSSLISRKLECLFSWRYLASKIQSNSSITSCGLFLSLKIVTLLQDYSRYIYSHLWYIQEELPHVRSQGQQPGETTPRLRPGAVARRSNPTPEARAVTGRSNPTSEGWWLPGHRRA